MGETSVETENREAIERLVDEALNNGQVSAAHELLADEFAQHGPRGSITRDQWMDSLAALRRTFTDYTLAIDDIIACDDKVVWRWTMSGVDHGGFMGRPPTGNAVAMQGINIERFERGYLVESWTAADHTPMLRALGLILEPG